jgi:hypothetical protein
MQYIWISLDRNLRFKWWDPASVDTSVSALRTESAPEDETSPELAAWISVSIFFSIFE